MKKTNAMRLLDSKKIKYNTYSYDIKDDLIDGLSVAKKIGKKPEDVYKTLLAQGASGENYVFIIPVAKELDLKLGASAVGEKSIHMIKVSEINKLTGYIRGGCSPLGMKKDFKTVLSEEAESRDQIIVSAGKIGSQIELSPRDLGEFLDLDFKDIIK